MERPTTVHKYANEGTEPDGHRRDPNSDSNPSSQVNDGHGSEGCVEFVDPEQMVTYSTALKKIAPEPGRHNQVPQNRHRGGGDEKGKVGHLLQNAAVLGMHEKPSIHFKDQARDVQPRQVAVQPVHDESPPLAQAEDEALIVVERAGQSPEFKDQVRNVKPNKVDYMPDRDQNIRRHCNSTIRHSFGSGTGHR